VTIDLEKEPVGSVHIAGNKAFDPHFPGCGMDQ
jgi:hypothetical protein